MIDRERFGPRMPLLSAIARSRGFFIGWMVGRFKQPSRGIAFQERKDMLGTKTRKRIELSITAVWISFLAIVLILLIDTLG